MTRQEILMQKVQSGTANPAEISELKLLSTPTGTDAKTLGVTPFKSTDVLKQELKSTADKELAKTKGLNIADIESTKPGSVGSLSALPKFESPVTHPVYGSYHTYDPATLPDIHNKLEKLSAGDYSAFLKPANKQPLKRDKSIISQYYKDDKPVDKSTYDNWGTLKTPSGIIPTKPNEYLEKYPFPVNQPKEVPSVKEVGSASTNSKTGSGETASKGKTKGQKFKDIAKNILEVFQAIEYAKAGVTKPTNIEQRQALEMNKEERDYIEKLMQSRLASEEAAAARRSKLDYENMTNQLATINAKKNAGLALTPEEKVLAMKNAQTSGANKTFIPE